MKVKEYLVCYDIIKPKEYFIKAKNKDEAKLKADKKIEIDSCGHEFFHVETTVEDDWYE